MATVPRLLLSASGAILTIVAVSLPGLWTSTPVATSPGLSLYRDLQFFAVYATALVACTALRAVAVRLDRAQLKAQAVQKRLVLADSDRLAVSRIRRVVHDTVLNTLEAIANGVAARHWPELRQRCEADLQAVDALEDISQPRELSQLIDSVQHLGLQVDLDVNWRSEPPPLVAEALLGASREALLNVAKHSGADRARVRALVDADAAWIVIGDQGRGFWPEDASGLGLRAAVMQTMQDVVGHATVASEPGRGTSVTLTWDAARERAAAVLAGLRRSSIRFTATLAAAAIVLWAIATTVDTGLAARPVRGLTLLLAAVVCAGVLASSYREPAPTPVLVAALAGLALVCLLLPLGDPFCASFQNDSQLDVRLVILLCLAAASTTWRLYPWAAAVTVGSSVLASAAVMTLSATCGWDYAMSSLVACGIALAAFGFSAAVQEQRMKVEAEAQARLHALSISAQRSAQARARLTSAPQVEAARQVLSGVVGGVADSLELRQQARATAQRLRQWLLLMAVDGPVPAILARASDASTGIVIEGDPSLVARDCPAARRAADRLRSWLPAREAHVRIVVSRAAGMASVLACSDGPAGQDPDGWEDEDGSWLHLTWQPPDHDARSPG